MKNGKFTKGPWSIQHSEDSDYIHVGVIDSRGIMPSAIVSLHDESNANLIAAAPEMYDLLERLSDYDECQMHKGEIGELLAKARGEQ